MWSRPTGLDFIFCFRLWLPSHLLSAARHHIRDEKISPIFHFQIAPTSHSMNVFNSGLNEDTQIQKVHVLKVKHVDVHRKKHVFEAEGINKAQMVHLQDCLWTRIPHNFYYYCTTLVFFFISVLSTEQQWTAENARVKTWCAIKSKCTKRWEEGSTNRSRLLVRLWRSVQVH